MMSIDWNALLVPTYSLLELVVRGTIMYLGLLFLLRVVLGRRSQGLSTPDVLLIVLIADAAQNGMATDYRSVTEGLVLVGTLLFWDHAIDHLAYRVPWVEKLTRPRPLLLIEHGRIKRHNMRVEFVTTNELGELLREHGVERVEDVERAYLEPSGKLSVVRRDDGS